MFKPLSTAQKMKFSIKDFFRKCLVTFTEEILNGKIYFLCFGSSLYEHFFKSTLTR